MTYDIEDSAAQHTFRLEAVSHRVVGLVEDCRQSTGLDFL